MIRAVMSILRFPRHCIWEISIFDTQFARLTRFDTQFACILKYKLPHANSFYSRVFILFSLLLWFSFSFLFFSALKKPDFHGEKDKASGNPIFSGGWKIKMRRKNKEVVKIGWKSSNRKNSRAESYISKGMWTECQIAWSVRIECFISKFLNCIQSRSPWWDIELVGWCLARWQQVLWRG